MLVESSTAERPSASGAVLAATKLQIPRARSDLVDRARLALRLAAAAEAKLALVQAPVGSGKTTLLAEWHALPEEERPFAWLSLDRSDNDPVRFLEGVITALATVEHEVGARALTHLAGPAALTDVVLPSLVNDLAAMPGPLVLVLDDYHLIANPQVHEVVTFLLDHQPATLQLAVATRAEPPLPLGRLRVRGEVVEVTAADLRFSDDEALTLLDRSGVPRLDAADLARLQRRTEGWAAGLRLAALSLSGRDDAGAFISSFAGDERPVVDYLGFEVLDGQPPDVRDFLLATSVLDRLCGSLCDRVTEREDSAARLDELEREGLLLVPLDARREWYRYHHLFAGLLRHELARIAPERIAALHRRASAWYRDADLAGDAIEHAIAGGDIVTASDLITGTWYGELQRGRIATVAGWLEALGDDVVAGETSLCLTKAWIGVNTGRLHDVGFWTDAGERAGASAAVLESGVASLREIHRYMDGDVEGAVEAGRRSVARGETPWRPVGCPVLGIALFWNGRGDEAVAELDRSAATARAAGNHLAVIHASGALAAIAAERADLAGADEVARAALRLAEARGLEEHWATTLGRVVHGLALQQEGLLVEAAEEIDRAVELSQRGVATLEIAYARLAQAEARRLRGDREGAADACRHARRAIDGCVSPGILRDMIARTERRLHLAPPVRDDGGPPAAGDLSDRERSVLRLLPTALSQREIGRELYVSLNTVKSHTRSIYRKLDVDSRDEAVARARALGLL